MKVKLWALGVGMALACSQSFAWMAVALSDDDHGSYVHSEALSPDQAIEGARNGCENAHRRCRVGKAVNGAVAVVAAGIGGTAYATSGSPGEAEARALKDCSSIARGCKVVQAVWDSGPVWGALAASRDAMQVRTNADSKEQAEADALARCRKRSETPQDCAIVPAFTRNERLHYVQALSSESQGFGYAASLDQAKAQALEACGAKAVPDSNCKVAFTALNESEEPEPKGMTRLRALAQRNLAGLTAPPPTPRATVATTTSRNVLRCTNQCVNGMCVRTFENGRKERWNAPRKFNPFTNNWEWDVTTNACGM